MALEDRKSGLQPSSVQAQQYRLQYSNLAPAGVAPDSITNRQPAPIASPRQTVSAFQAPAVPVTAPTPIPPVSQTPAAVPATFTKAAFFDGATVYSASLVGGNDFMFKGSNFGALTFSVDLIFKPAAPDSLRHTIFHTYSGSFMSQSLELYITGSNLILEFTNGQTTFNQQVIEHRTSFFNDLESFANRGLLAHMTNGFSYFAARMRSTNSTFVEVKFKSQTYGSNNFPGIPNIFDTSNNTHFYIGGSPTKNSYYSGSIASILFVTGSTLTNQQWGDMALRDLNPATVSPQLRTYTFNNAPAEFTGSQASFSRPLELVAGALSYVDSYLK